MHHRPVGRLLLESDEVLVDALETLDPLGEEAIQLGHGRARPPRSRGVLPQPGLHGEE